MKNKSRDAEFPRLRVHHFLLWMLMTATYSTALRTVVGERWQHPATAFHGITWSVGILVISGNLSILLLAASWKWRGIIKSLQPGEWIAIYWASVGLWNLASIPLSGLFIHLSSPLTIDSHDLAMLGPTAVFGIIWSAAFAWFAWRMIDSPGWCFVYLLCMTVPLGEAISSIGILVTNYGPVITSLSDHWTYEASMWILTACISVLDVRDVATKIRWRWTHGFGISLWLLSWLEVQAIDFFS